MMAGELMPRQGGLASEKIRREHRERLAIVYVRQSTVQQIERHQESTRLQYALVDRAFHLGWARENIVVIDDDLGRSGATAEGRLGFQRLVAQVGLDKVGLVLGIEMSRLARSCRDWHQLLEICALFDTLIADADGVYDPANHNDRLLLGLKGTMSEAELHIIKARMLEGRRAKAARGELGRHVPMGYVRRPSGEIVLDPDEQAQTTIRLVFDLFERWRTIGKVMSHFARHDIRLPVRVLGGPNKGELEWRRPSRPTLQNLFTNPIYAGAYVYGLRSVDRRRQKPGRPGTGRRHLVREDERLHTRARRRLGGLDDRRVVVDRVLEPLHRHHADEVVAQHGLDVDVGTAAQLVEPRARDRVTREHRGAVLVLNAVADRRLDRPMVGGGRDDAHAVFIEHDTRGDLDHVEEGLPGEVRMVREAVLDVWLQHRAHPIDHFSRARRPEDP